jgi:K+/H+ antiporter YhaU regulatory subunit KhtT
MQAPTGAPPRMSMIMPQPDAPLSDGDILILIGRDPDLSQVPEE